MQHPSTIRLATEADLPAIRTLVGRGVRPETFLAHIPGQAYTLVLDQAGKLGACAQVQMHDQRAQITALYLGSGFGAAHAETRILSVIESLAEAFGCSTLEMQRAA